MSRLALFVALAAPAVVSLPRDARAEASAADNEAARRLVSEARDKRAAGDTRGALAALQAADALTKAPTTGLEVARTEVALAQLVEARDTALRVARSRPEGDEPAPFTRAREEARELSEQLVKKIPTVTVVVAGVEAGKDPVVLVDGASVPAASLGMPRTLNPGHHTIVASSGGRHGRIELYIAEAEHKEVKLELGGGTASVEPPPVHADGPGGGGFGRPLFVGGAVIAAAGVALGSVTGIVSLSKTSSVKSNCQGNTCPASQASDIDAAESLATISTVGFLVGGAGAAAAIVGLVVWSGEPPAEGRATTGARVRPYVGPTSAGLLGVF